MKYVLTLCFITGIFAQERPNDDDNFSDYDDNRKERMEMMMVWRLTEDLNLNPDQAEKFFPRFNKHRDQLDENKKMIKALGKDMRTKLKNDEKISNKDIEKTVKKMSELRKKQIDLETEFLLGMDNLLSPEQLANLGMFKQKMMKDVRGELKERGPKHKRGMRGNKGKRGFKMNRGFQF